MPALSPEAVLAASGVAPAPTPGFRPLRWIHRLAQRLAAAERRRADQERLESMPDYLLADIGLSRADLRTPETRSRLGAGW